MLNYPIVQVAYFVEDSKRAAASMVNRFGAGPFFLIERIELAWAEHRGQPSQFLHTSAYGQWGEIMVELVQQEEEGPSPFRDMYQPGETGIHHTAMMIDSLPETYAYCAREGLEIAARAETLTGTEFAFIDTVTTMGHMLEIYERSEQLMGFYSMVREASSGWQGNDPIRRI